MSSQKKTTRRAFRNACFERDRFTCVCCGYKPPLDEVDKQLDAHHIIDRNDILGGGYVRENGITLCHPCHEKAEQLHRTGVAVPGYTREELYAKIGSSFEQALRASERLND